MTTSRNRFVAAVGLALASILSGCTGSPSSHADWAEKADQAIGQAVSGLGTVRIVLESYPEQRLTRSYAVVTLTDALEVTDHELASFDTLQPPDDSQELGTAVVDALHRTAVLLARIRTAYAAPDLSVAGARDLLAQVKDALARLDALDQKVTGAGA